MLGSFGLRDGVLRSAPFLALAAFFVAACGGSAPPGARSRASGEPRPAAQSPGAEDFEGLWVVDQPAHALYEATYYRFLPGGHLAPGSTVSSAGSRGPDAVTGTVANCIAKATVTCEATINCRFARSWSASGNVLTLASDCSDGTSRDVRLSFTRDPQTGAFGNVTLLTVGGETGWSHNDFLWRFRKCPGTDEEQCASLH